MPRVLEVALSRSSLAVDNDRSAKSIGEHVRISFIIPFGLGLSDPLVWLSDLFSGAGVEGPDRDVDVCFGVTGT